MGIFDHFQHLKNEEIYTYQVTLLPSRYMRQPYMRQPYILQLLDILLPKDLVQI